MAIFRDAAEFGDIIKYDDSRLVFMGRMLALVTRMSSLNVVGLANVAVVDVFSAHDEDSSNYAESWNTSFEMHGTSFAFDWGDTTRRSSNGRLVPLSLANMSPFFGDGDREIFKKCGSCPRCGFRGEFISLALVCPFHGIYV